MVIYLENSLLRYVASQLLYPIKFSLKRITLRGQQNNVLNFFLLKPLLTRKSQTHQAIARFLPKDLDVTNYALICKTTLQSVTDSIWFERFIHTFDRPDIWTSVAHLAQLYKNRSELSRATTCFDTRHFTGIKGGLWKVNTLAQLRNLQTNNGPLWLEFLRDLIKGKTLSL